MRSHSNGLGIFLSILSSTCQALVIKFDEIMMKDCYENKPKVAWFVSICGGIMFGSLTTLILWLLFAANTGGIEPIYIQFIHLAIEGFWMFWVGVFSMVVMGAYFYLFIPTQNSTPDINTISMWLASTPLWVYFASFLIVESETQLWPFSSLQLGPVSLPIVLLAVTSILLIVWYDNANQGGQLTSNHFFAVVVLIVLITLYIIVASSLLFQRDLIDVLALQPYYWFGFSTGLLLLLSKKMRRELVAFKPNFLKYYKIILIAEVIGAFVFIFEIYALWKLSGVLVNLVTSGHVIILFFITLLLTSIGYKMKEKDSRITIGSVQINSSQLITVNLTGSRIAIFSITTAILGLAITVLG